MALAAGTRLDCFEIVALLGAGGMGEVYRARDTTLKRDVAIKVLPELYSRDPERLRRFELEAQAAAALNHPNITSIFYVGKYDGSPYIVTELLHGETLRERLRNGPLPLRQTLDYGVEIARGLAAAHDAGVIHRDLKPENIFVTKDGAIKILDFGLAKFEVPTSGSSDNAMTAISPRTEPGQVLGTVGYMSPEQVRGESADARSDIFAVGAVLFEVLTGRPAFRKGTSAETMSAILNEDPAVISQLAPNLPPGLQRVVNHCLAKSSEKRFQHASDLACALEALSDSNSGVVPAIKPTTLNKRWILIAAALAVIAIAVAVYSWWRVPSADPVIQAVTQLTDDGEPKPNLSYLATDGSRVYFNEDTTGSLKIAQVAVVGGLTAIISSRFANPQLIGLSPDGSALLALVGGNIGLGRPAYPLWEIALPAGEPRRLGSIEAQDATFSPDGRIVFSHGPDLFIAEKDASSSRKLVSIAGNIFGPSVSPNGQRLVFTTVTTSFVAISIVETRTDGSGLQPIVKASLGEQVCCARWTPNGRYVVFAKSQGGRQDLWAVQANPGLFQRSKEPVQLTNGPLSYAAPVVSLDGKQIFAIGTKLRGELVYYDVKSKQFLPFLSGISGLNITVSRDGQWVAYTSYPDHTLWRSRADGSDRLQLTYPPMQVWYPFISPDGKRVVYGNDKGEVYVISMEGGSPQRIAEKDSQCANWSPDGNLLIFSHWTDSGHSGSELQILDLRSGKVSVVPSSQGLVGGQWVSQDMLVASALGLWKGVLIFDVKTQKWSKLVPEDVVNWAHSLDYKYLYYTTGGAEPQAKRMRIADHKVETIASLRGLRRARGPDGNTQISVAADGSVVFTRDVGTQEIYALTVKWP